jgi:hypothetical protein
MASPDALRALVDALVAEQERRRAERQRVGDDARAWLLAQLSDMHERLTKAPGYVAPTAAEKEQMILKLEAQFRELGYDISG